MKKLTGNQIRNTWIEFFKEKGHHLEPGASLIPKNDPTLLWINSGVAALKKYFDGSEIPASRRIVNVQKSLRTNDMDEVGLTARHQTFFEMLGCFSIGDYFRSEIIPWAYEILTSPKYFDMPKEKLYFTHHPQDEETVKLWLKCGVEKDHLIPLESNYWQIGEGPCGPNTEVFFDRGEKYDSQNKGIELLRKDLENDRYIEIWGIVFSQFNAVNGVEREKYKELPSKNIDTGAGLERIACVLQETPTNFETDLFYPLIKATENIAKVPYETNLMPYRVIADHIRACTFALADGESFSNEGRGYVLRRLLRRAMLYARRIGINRPFLYLLVPAVVLNMDSFYPYLDEKAEQVAKMIKAEEEKFLKTLSNGDSLLKKMAEGKTKLEGSDAFKLYDTYGFPLELTKEVCDYMGIEVDEVGFKEQMELQKERARSARSTQESMNRQSKDLLDFKTKSEFSYCDNPIEAKVIGLFVDGVKVNSIDNYGDIIFDDTTFYAESGGQVSDVGYIENSETRAEVISVAKAPNKQHLHSVTLQYGEIKVGDTLKLNVNHENRLLIMRNHSATHLLQVALTEVLGDHIKQEGSFVSSEYLRFDFTHNAKINEVDLLEIEKKVNHYIAAAIPGETKVLPIEEARKIGARAFFDEKYGDVVRVVCFGDVSKEFCGGTHVPNTQDIGVFAIEFEESIASGIRRIQAKTSLGAYEFIKQKEQILNNVRDLVKAKSVYEVNDRIKSSLKEFAELKELNDKLRDDIADALSQNLKDEIVTYSGYHLLAKFLPKVRREGLLKIADRLKSCYEDYVIFLIGDEGASLPVVCMFGGSALKDGIDASSLVKDITKTYGGSGGGRKDMASGALKDREMVNKALDAVKKALI